MTLQQEFQDRVNNNDYSEGRQAKATRRGFVIERVAKEMLERHPRVKEVHTQLFVETIDEFSQIDLVAELTTGEMVYIPVNVDLWIGTSQQDRLQSVYYKTKTGQLDNVHYCYLCWSDVVKEINEWAPKTKNNRRGVKIHEVLELLREQGRLHNIDTLFTYISNV